MLDQIVVPLSRLLIVALWTTGAGLIVLGLLEVADLASLGLLVAMAGGVLTIRDIIATDSARQRRAFLLGRESVGAEDRALRSVRG